MYQRTQTLYCSSIQHPIANSDEGWVGQRLRKRNADREKGRGNRNCKTETSAKTIEEKPNDGTKSSKVSTGVRVGPNEQLAGRRRYWYEEWQWWKEDGVSRYKTLNNQVVRHKRRRPRPGHEQNRDESWILYMTRSALEPRKVRQQVEGTGDSTREMQVMRVCTTHSVAALTCL